MNGGTPDINEGNESACKLLRYSTVELHEKLLIKFTSLHLHFLDISGAGHFLYLLPIPRYFSIVQFGINMERSGPWVFTLINSMITPLIEFTPLVSVNPLPLVLIAIDVPATYAQWITGQVRFGDSEKFIETVLEK